MNAEHNHAKDNGEHPVITELTNLQGPSHIEEWEGGLDVRLPAHHYRGWSPCAHSKEELAELDATYLLEGSVQDLIVAINDLGGAPTIMVDQWWGIRTTGELKDSRTRNGQEVGVERPFESYIQGDTLELTLTETYLTWKALWEHDSGRKYEWGPKPKVTSNKTLEGANS